MNITLHHQNWNLAMPRISSHPARIALASRRGSLVLRVLRAFFRMTHLSAQRRALSHLDIHILRDIGITPEQARREANRPGWDAPTHWHG
jgi:uncharacterized protein YjiS (DUF1127 family)